MPNKIRILIFIDWFLPAYKAGGPIRSIANLVDHLNGDFDFYIITGDRDLGDVKPIKDIFLNSWIIDLKDEAFLKLYVAFFHQ